MLQDQLVFVGLGSNLGNRQANLAQARRCLCRKPFRLIRTSPIYETEPVDFKAQAWFLNEVISIETSLNARDLLASCLEIERSMGRRRSVPGGPRSIDVDILLYGSQIVNEKDLTIPHPRLHLRRFVLVPLVAIAPDIIHPVLHQSLKSLLAQCPDQSSVQSLTPSCRNRS